MDGVVCGGEVVNALDLLVLFFLFVSNLENIPAHGEHSE